MGKRIIRIFPDSFSDSLNKQIGEMATVILKDGLTFRGKLSNIEADQIKITLKSNRSPYFEINQIQEIQIDKVTEW